MREQRHRRQPGGSGVGPAACAAASVGGWPLAHPHELDLRLERLEGGLCLPDLALGLLELPEVRRLLLDPTRVRVVLTTEVLLQRSDTHRERLLLGHKLVLLQRLVLNPAHEIAHDHVVPAVS